MAPVLWVIAILSNLTVVHRMIYTWEQTKALERAQLDPAGASLERLGESAALNLPK
jgi:CDP-diacylglycerol--glycerol-3-phosphate 3-phosphatidyltransferase